MLRHDGYISLCLNIRIVGVSIHYCTAERISRILICECVLVMADSHKRFTDESSFDDRNSHDPVNPLAAVEPSAHPAEGAGPPPDGGQGDLPSLLKKKPTSFQITSVTVQGSRLSTDGGDDSADDLDESHTEDLSSDVLDLSRTTDVDNDPLSEENSNNAAAEAVKSIPVKQAAESQPTKVETPTAESDIPSLSSNINMQSVPTVLPTSTLPIDVSNTKSAEPTNEPSSKAPTIPDQWQHRFKVVKIVSSQPYKRGRWLCMDFMDPPSIPVSEAKSEVPVEAMTNVTVGSGSHAETVMCGTQTTNNVAHVYEIPPNESYPGSISVTVCPQPIQQPFYGIFLPLNNSQMPDMAAMPRGFAQDSTRKFESNVPSMQPITVGFINQPSQFSNVSSSMQQAPSYVSGSNKSYEESSTQSQSYVSQPPSQTQSFAPQSQQQQPLVTQSQNFSSASQQQQQPTQTTQAQSFVPQSQQQQQQQQQQPLVTQSQNFSSVPQQQQQPAQTTQVQSFAPQSQQQPLVTQSQNFSSVPQQQQPAQTTQVQSFAPQSQQQQQPLVTQSQNFSSVPQQQQQTTQSFAPQSQQQPLVTQSQTFSSVPQQQPPVQTTQTQSFIQQPTPQVLSSAPSIQIQSVSQAGSQQLTPTQPVTDTSMQVTQAVSSVVAPSVQQQALPSEQIPPSIQPAVPPPTAFNSQNLTQTSGSSESVPPMTVGQAMSTATTVASGNNIPSVNVPSSIPDNVISSIMQPTTSKEVHNVPSQLHYNHVDARENVQSSTTQPAAESASEVSASKTATADEAESAPSGSNTVAIDNKIEQAMDLVKSHLMFAVREEVDVLKEKITELVERISLLEYENTFLKANASQETLSQLNQSQQLHQQQQQQQQQTQNAAIATTQSQPQQNLQSQQPTL